MKIEFDKRLLRVVPENECDNLFLEEILKVSSGKVYSRVCDRENRYGKVFKTIELSAFRENLNRRAENESLYEKDEDDKMDKDEKDY